MFSLKKVDRLNFDSFPGTRGTFGAARRDPLLWLALAGRSAAVGGSGQTMRERTYGRIR